MLGALIAISTGGGLLLVTQPAGASTPPPTVTNVVDNNLSSGFNYSLASTAGGETITIQGTNLVDVTAIDFGGIPGTDILCFGDTTCNVVDPSAATPSTVFVTVTAAGGTSATYNGAGDELVYHYPTNLTVAPAILSLAPLTLSLFTLTATLTGPDGPVSGASVQFVIETTPSIGADPPNYQILCTTATNSKGVATCAAATDAPEIIEASPPGYFVESAPTATQLPTFRTAPLLTL
jgi:hypothetical protein